ncbi:putative isochorismatase [Bacillus clarus]|uniref:Putative isochorismatase n=1 Tax=Bacillus clarus TaxID=2338372 RepID=A0A090Z0V7_9BACI|nr:putative isochorismatase [Bacillus clarus]
MKKALLVIDVQAGMYTAGMPVHNEGKLIRNIARTYSRMSFK